MKLYLPIKKNVLTEKTSLMQGMGKYTFLVDRKATKTEVKNAVRDIYGVKAATVRMVVSPKKERYIGRNIWTKRPVMKRAIVTLEKGKTIDPNKLEAKKK